MKIFSIFNIIFHPKIGNIKPLENDLGAPGFQQLLTQQNNSGFVIFQNLENYKPAVENY